MSGRMPAVFIGHGSPMNAILKNDFTASLAALGSALPRPKAIMVVSAHWLTRGTLITCDRDLETIHDFWGFPKELYEIRYRAQGSPDLAKKALARLPRGAACGEWGIDHAAWSPLRHMFPDADVPVFELSVDLWKPPKHHYDLGKKLASLREQGVLVMGSGNIVHNLSLLSPEMSGPVFPWAREFDEKAKALIAEGDDRALFDYASWGEIGRLAVPTPDHYYPMLTVLGTRQKGEQATFTHEGIQHGSVSMRCFTIG
jgi:4,5-DOPA dioxygenase extradiol